ncbi:DEAD/DEAH box helicase family protein [Salidesulfovibrio onnuriiensis]|uniref:DEAD/DEAH box helicase family protein n=1 Tax=Salidesulfovibrio onnuriiensis TaxID=2583823 RepID=UPI0011CBE5B1|nr:DEAD/DEAH box helicase family protein [Salidesulfovibrio onnuriiensis]
MPFQDLSFQATWREYQARVLGELEEHLDDNNLHIVAAPGSGKTVLGLEVMRRLNQPTLIIAPSLAIRDQWIQRLKSMFVPKHCLPVDWISTDVTKPERLTVITYQALHTAFRGSNGEDDHEAEPKSKASALAKAATIINRLKQCKIKTLILDEAHHLRNEWWKALTHLKGELSDPTVVSLTATPPYDVTSSEWDRYEELCGAIDSEISVPELIKRGDLCPHQDYVHFSLPDELTGKALQQFNHAVDSFEEELKNNDEFIQMLLAHSWYQNPSKHIEEILREPRHYTAILVFLNATGVTIPHKNIEILGIDKASFPSLSTEWLANLLEAVLVKVDGWCMEKYDLRRNIEKKLRKIGGMNGNSICLFNPPKMKKLLAKSTSKLNSILEVTRAETKNMGDELRLVILADYIRKEHFPSSEKKQGSIPALGVVPIFEKLRNNNIPGLKPCILTGSLVVIPTDAGQLLTAKALQMGLDETAFSIKPTAFDERFAKITAQGKAANRMVHLVTELFNTGSINTIVGTQALLGEGWDAPSLNTLILATYVGSYMLSNQMRGRAIRTNPKSRTKVANIWHMATLDLINHQQHIATIERIAPLYGLDPTELGLNELGEDFKNLRRRFTAFEGPSYEPPHVIVNGVERLGIDKIQWDKPSIQSFNEQSLDLAMQRSRLPDEWDTALVGNSEKPKLREAVRSSHVPRVYGFHDFVIAFFLAAGILTLRLYGEMNEAIWRGIPVETAHFIFGFTLLFPGYYALKGTIRYFRTKSIKNNMEYMGAAILDTLVALRKLQTNPRRITITTVQESTDSVYCYLRGGTKYEKCLFYGCLEELLGPITNNRFLLKRIYKVSNPFSIPYLPVPSLFGKKERYAQIFFEKWRARVEKVKLINTWTQEGRRILLKARGSDITQFGQEKTKRISIWE